MGIRGLFTYVTKNADQLLERYYLKNCDVVIDACSLSAQLYFIETKSDGAFGGDYDKFRQVIIQFFDRLRKCNIKPIVIIDGGFEYRKLPEVYERMEQKITRAEQLSPNAEETYGFPLQHMDTFRGVLQDLKIHVISSDFDSDHEIAYIARQLNCPVLSSNSSFYIYDVLYVSFATLDQQIKTVDGVNCLPCQLFRTEKLLEHFGGLDKRHLPLMSTLYGNGFVTKSTFNYFFKQLLKENWRAPNKQHKHPIGTLISWLSRETLDSAVSNVLTHVGQRERDFVANAIIKSVSVYLHGASEDVFKYVTSPDSLDSPELVDNNAQPYELCDESDRFGRKFPVPARFIANYRRTRYTPKFITAITKGMLVLATQKEDAQLKCSHVISFDLIRSLVGLLTVRQNYRNFTLIMRNGATYGVYKVTPNYMFSTIDPLPELDTLLTLPENVKRGIFNEIVELSQADCRVIDKFPRAWRINVIAIVYWARHITDLTLRSAHVCAVTLCALYLDVIDKTIGFYRSEVEFTEKFATQLKQAKNNEVIEDNPMSLVEVELEGNDVSGISTSFKDALLAAEVFLPYFKYDSRVVPYDVQVVHAYAELQSVTRWISDINDLLFPELFDGGRASYMYNGTFIYNAFVKISNHTNPDEYVKLVLKDAGDFYGLYKQLIGLFHELLPELVVPLV